MTPGGLLSYSLLPPRPPAPRTVLRLLLLIGLAAAGPVAAQSAEELYHSAAGLYIAGDNPAAEAAAVQGLRQAPDDRRLQALLEAIRQQDQNGGAGQAAGEDAEQQRPGGDQPGPDDAGPPETGDAGEPDAAGEEPADTDPQDGREGEAGEEGDGRPDQPGANGQQAGAQPSPGGLSQEEAERILRAIEADEQDLLQQVQRRPARNRNIERDW